MGRAMREPSPEGRACFAAIHADPRDDAPRLIYAGWLDEHGDSERAEFIRLQVALERVPAGHLPPPWLDRRGRTRDTARDPRRTKLARRAATLLKRHGRRWAEPLAGQVARYEFRRGFIEAVEITAACFVRLGRGLVDTAPIRHVWLIAADEHLDDLLATPALSRLDGLDVSWSSFAPQRQWTALLTSPRLRRLQVLRAEKSRGRAGLSDATLRALFATTHFKRLTELDLMDQGLKDRHIKALANWPCLAKVARLDLTGSEFGEAGAQALARSPYLRRLVEPNLSHTYGSPTEAGWRALLESPNLARLTWLGIDDAEVGGEIEQALKERYGEKALDRRAGY